MKNSRDIEAVSGAKLRQLFFVPLLAQIFVLSF